MNTKGEFPHPTSRSTTPSSAKPSKSDPTLRVVAIGGGTGLGTLLRGLKRYVATPDRRRGLRIDAPSSTKPAPCPTTPCLIGDLSAIVTVTDDGGSSGRLREDFKMLPPGDVRNCMVALSEDEHLLSRLFQYRFDQGELDGHSFGNLFVAALSHITGDFAQAVQMSSQILATRGRIFPATNSNVELAARMDDGGLVEGETNITASKQRIVELMLVPATAQPLPEALEAIAQADLITLGPGSLYTSLITNLLVQGIPEAIAASKATRVYVCNLMTQANESIGLTASQHIQKILEHASAERRDIHQPARRDIHQPARRDIHQPARRDINQPARRNLNQSARREDETSPGRSHTEQHPLRGDDRRGPNAPPTRPLFDYALINTGPISPTLVAQYAREGQTPIEADLDRVRALGVEPITGNFVHEGDVLRHDYDRVADTLLALAVSHL